jgi:hypothetical protein
LLHEVLMRPVHMTVDLAAIIPARNERRHTTTAQALLIVVAVVAPQIIERAPAREQPCD